MIAFHPSLVKAITDLLRHCERALKRAVLHRKNALFYRTLHGAEAGDLFMSLIHTCELAENPSAWMPWNCREALARRAAPTAA